VKVDARSLSMPEDNAMKRLAPFAIIALVVGAASAVTAANYAKPYPSGQAAAGSRARLSAPAAFPASTTIYIVPGVRDSGAANQGTATSIVCSNVSGALQSVRILTLKTNGEFASDKSMLIFNGGTKTASTHVTFFFPTDLDLQTGTVFEGVFSVESTNAAVFCTAHVIDAGAASASGFDLHVIRVNAAPGTVG
jgi:hypothetical protein